MARTIHLNYAGSPGNYALVGIQHLGVPLAERLKQYIIEEFNWVPDFACLDISMYRDDIGNRARLPEIRETNIPFDVDNKTIVLVDDVLSSGRTIRAALDALTDYGRPGIIRLAVLVDRGNPEFPIRADVTGFNVSSPDENKIVVDFENNPGIYERQWNLS